MKKLFLTIALMFMFSLSAFGASGIYDGFMYDLAGKAVDMDTDTFKVALLNNSHTFTAADDTRANVLPLRSKWYGATLQGGVFN